MALVVVILAAVLWSSYQNNAKSAGSSAKTAVTGIGPAISPNVVPMSVVSVTQSDGFYNIQAEYPQFSGVDPAFNKKISSLINDQIKSFQKESKDNFDARNATMPAGQKPLKSPEQPFDFIASMTPAQFSPAYVSFMIDIYYFSGGANGIDQIFAFNYDLKNKKEISITDFAGSQAGLDKLASLAQSQVTSQLQSNGLQIDSTLKQMIADGTKSTSDNYSNFTFGYGKLTVYFEQYQAAPGSAGTITTVFYKSDLDQNSINSSYLN